MPHSGKTQARKAAMQGMVTDLQGSDRRECLIWAASPAGCRISGNVDDLPDLLNISVRGVAQPMKGRVAARASGSLEITFVREDAPEPEPAAEEADTVLELDKVYKPEPTPAADAGASDDQLSDEEIVKIYMELEKSILARLG